MNEEIVPSELDAETVHHFAHCMKVINKAKFKIGNSVRLTRKGRREVGFRFKNRKYLRGKGIIKEVKIHTFVRGERNYPDEPFYIVEFGKQHEKLEIDIWERFLKRSTLHRLLVNS